MSKNNDEDEEDYMSDMFVAENPDKDVRPGLVKNRTINRKNELEKRRKRLAEELQEQKRNKKELASKALRTGLEVPINSENKGFALLQKMGFNPGSGLGKSGEGRLEPVPIELKNDRHGLGRKTALKEVAQMKKALILAKTKDTTSDYLARVRGKHQERNTSIDLHKSQKVCYLLDNKQGIDEPAEPWFWPENKEEKTGKDSKNQQIEEAMDLEVSPEENSNNQDDSDSEPPQEEDEDVDMQLLPTEKLQIITLYLRRTHFYCIWCAVQFDDERDLQKECPGPTRDDH